MAKITRVDHVAYAVHNLDEALPKVERLYGAKVLGRRLNPEGQYVVAFTLFGQSLVTFMESTSPEGFIAKHVEEKGESIQHLGMQVYNLEELIAELEAKGVRVANKMLEGPVRKEALVGPRNAFGHVYQLIEWLGPYRQASVEERLKAFFGV